MFLEDALKMRDTNEMDFFPQSPNMKKQPDFFCVLKSVTAVVRGIKSSLSYFINIGK
jgi:hypothetical protein